MAKITLFDGINKNIVEVNEAQAKIMLQYNHAKNGGRYCKEEEIHDYHKLKEVPKTKRKTAKKTTRKPARKKTVKKPSLLDIEGMTKEYASHLKKWTISSPEAVAAASVENLKEVAEQAELSFTDEQFAGFIKSAKTIAVKK